MKHIGLFWRTYILLLSVFLLVLVLFAAFAELSVFPALRQQSTHAQRWTAETLVSLADRSILDERLNALRSSGDVSVTLYDRSGARTAGTGAPRIQPLAGSDMHRSFGDRELSTYTLSDEYVVFDTPAQSITVEVPDVVLALLLVMLLAWAISRSLSRPLLQLQSVVRRFGQGDLELRANTTRTDELGHLARAFDRMADQIVAAMQLEKHVVAGISHELRTPLHRLRLGLELAQESDGLLTGEELAAVEEDLSELERLLSGVLAFARTNMEDASRLLLDHDEVSLSSICFDVAERFRGDYPARTLVCEIEDGLATHGDDLMLRRVVGNLLSNAANYSAPPAPITLTARQRQGQLELRVMDQGAGIRAENHQRIFEPFDRGEHAGQGTGIGVGLSFVSRVVEAHGGSVEVESAVGKGSVFIVSLPVTDMLPRTL